MFLFCLVKLSERVLALNDLSGTVSPLEKDDKEKTIEEEENDEMAKKKKTDADKRFVVLLILATVIRLGFCDACIVYSVGLSIGDSQYCMEHCLLLKSRYKTSTAISMSHNEGYVGKVNLT